MGSIALALPSLDSPGGLRASRPLLACLGSGMISPGEQQNLWGAVRAEGLKVFGLLNEIARFFETGNGHQFSILGPSQQVMVDRLELLV